MSSMKGKVEIVGTRVVHCPSCGQEVDMGDPTTRKLPDHKMMGVNSHLKCDASGGDPFPLCEGGLSCCDRANEYNGFSSGPLLFTCPSHCCCHD